MKYSINYDVSFGIDVTQKEIDDLRKSLNNSHIQESIFDLIITKDSSDIEIAKFIGLANYRSAEATDVQNIESYDYPKEIEN